MAVELKLASYNIQDGIYEDDIVKSIRSLVAGGVDIFCLQETRIIKPNFIIDRLKNELGGEWQAEYFLGVDNPRLEIGLTILWKSTKVNLQKLEKIFLPKLNYVGLYDYLVTSLFTPAQRGAIVAIFEINGIMIRVVNLHLDFKNGLARRMSQVKYLSHCLSEKPITPHEIVCGDFNTHISEVNSNKQNSWILHLLGTEFIDAFPNLKWTFDGDSVNHDRVFSGVQKILLRFGIRFYRKLDYVFLKNVKLKNAKMEKLKGSDHYPLIVEIDVAVAT